MGISAVAALVGTYVAVAAGAFAGQLGGGALGLLPPVLAATASVAGLRAAMRGFDRGERTWMAVTGIVSGLVVLVVWTFAFVALILQAVAWGVA